MKMDFKNLTEEEEKNLEEMLSFWTWMKGLNNLVKWAVFIGAPVTIGIWAVINWIKKH